MVALKSVLFLASIVAVDLLAQGCASQSPASASYAAPASGSTWVYVRRDTGSFGSTSTQLPIQRGTLIWKGVEHITFESPEQAVVSTPDGWVGLFREGKPMVTWDPPLNFKWPIAVGKSWSTTHTQVIPATQQSQSLEVKMSVDAYEEVVVPAGTFKAFRLKIADNMGSENVAWYSPDLAIYVKQNQRRTDKHQQGPGTRDIELASQAIRK